MVGTSRKSFLGRARRHGLASRGARAGERLPGTIATNVLALERGASVFACTTSRPVREALAVAAATLGARWTRTSDGDERPDDELDDETTSELDETEQAPSRSRSRSPGLSLYTHHGVSEAEREVGQRLVLDLRLDVGETDATVTDSIEDTVDYAEVCQLVALVAQQRSHKTLERLCSDDRRPAARRLRAGGRMGEGDQARATDPAERGGGLG